MIVALRANCLAVEKVVTQFSKLATNAQYFEINPLLGPLKDVQYHLHGGNLYFAGDGAAVSRVLLGGGFKVSDWQTAELTLLKSLEILRPLLPKVKPILPVRRNMSPEEITSGSQTDIAFPSPQLIRKKGFYSSFRKIALKKSWEKEAILMAIIGLLNDGQGQFAVPVGDDP